MGAIVDVGLTNLGVVFCLPARSFFTGCGFCRAGNLAGFQDFVKFL